MKAAQMFATVPDLLPPEFAAELAELQTNAPATGWPFVRRRMAAELGPDWASKFQSFEHEAAAAASAGPGAPRRRPRRPRPGGEAAISRTCRARSKATLANCAP